MLLTGISEIFACCNNVVFTLILYTFQHNGNHKNFNITETFSNVKHNN